MGGGTQIPATCRSMLTPGRLHALKQLHRAAQHLLSMARITVAAPVLLLMLELENQRYRQIELRCS